MKTTKVLVFLMIVVTFTTNAQTFTKADVQVELDKYPSNVIKSYLSDVQITELPSDGLSLTGNKIIRIRKDVELWRMKEVLHHEFSSLLLWNSGRFKEIEKEFKILNEGFQYDMSYNNSNVAWIKIDEASEKGKHFYNYQYSLTNFENDFNIIAESLFTDGEKVINFMSRNSDKPVGKKIQIVLDFYQSLDPRFTKAYFQNQKL